MIITPGAVQTDNIIIGSPVSLDLPTVYPTPVYVKGDKGDPGDPGAVTPEFIDRVADEVSVDLADELNPPINLLLLFDNAII